MVNDNGNQFSNVPDNIPVKKNVILYFYLNKLVFNWVQPRFEFCLENDNKKQKQKTQQMFYKSENTYIYIKKAVRESNRELKN